MYKLLLWDRSYPTMKIKMRLREIEGIKSGSAVARAIAHHLALGRWPLLARVRTHARTHAHAHAHALAGAGRVDLRWRRQASAQDFAVAEALEKEVDELKAELGRLKSDTLAARTAASSPAPRRRARGFSDKFSEDSNGALSE